MHVKASLPYTHEGSDSGNGEGRMISDFSLATLPAVLVCLWDLQYRIQSKSGIFVSPVLGMGNIR